MNPETPEFLYHYTSVETLALILSGKKIRFRQLCQLNDPLEGKNPDFELAESLVFSSSWTANEQDTLPMWNMYSGLDGVRIKLPSDMFVVRQDIRFGSWRTAEINYANLPSPITVIGKPNHEGQRTVNRLNQITGPEQIFYRSRERVSEIPAVLSFPVGCGHTEDNSATSINLAHVGLYKSIDWEFEQEWRFRLPIMIDHSIIGMDFAAYCTLLEPDASYIDVPLRNEVFDTIEILMGPAAGADKLTIVQGLAAEYAPHAEIAQSGICIRT